MINQPLYSGLFFFPISPLHIFNFMTLPTLLHPSFITIFLNQDGVTIGLEVLLPKEAKLHSDVSQPLQYDVFLYKVANNGDSTSHSHGPHSSISQPIPKSPKTPKSPKSPKLTTDPISVRHPSPSHHSIAGCPPSPSRQSETGSYSSRAGHPNSPLTSSQQTCRPALSSTPPQPRSPRGRAPNSERSARWRDYQSGPIRSSPSSPHLTQVPPSPYRGKCGAVSTRSLPPLS